MSFAQTTEKRFFFHGNAIAFAAHIRRPDDFFIHTVARSCLPVTGGLAEANEKAQSFRDLISFESASSKATGDYKDSKAAVAFTNGNHGDNELPTSTIVESRLKGFKIQIPQPAAGGASPAIRKLEIDQLYLRVENTSDRSGPTAFHSLNAEITGASVDGHALSVVTDPELFCRHDTKQKLEHAFQQSADFHERHGHHFFSMGRDNDPRKLPQAHGIVLGTVVKSIKWVSAEAEGCKIIGNHQLKIAGIGSVYFGEVIIEEDFRRTTLLRFQLGSPNGGEGSACEAQSGGHWYPPR